MIPRAAVRIVAVSLALKLALLAAAVLTRPGSVLYTDTGTYLRPAKALLRTGYFSPSVARSPEPEINRTPGYPLLVAAVFGIFGEKPALLSAAGALLSAVTALLLARLATRLYGQRIALAAVLFLCLDFGSFYRSLDLLSDTTFTCLLLLGLVLLAEAIEAGTPPRAFGAGFALAAATHVRPISLYLLPILALAILVAAGREGGERALRTAAAFVIPCGLLVGGWFVRNALRAGAWVFSPISSSELLFYRGARVLSLATGASFPAVQERLGNRERWWREGGAEREEEIFGAQRYADLHPETSRLPLAELEARWRRQAFVIFREHPAETLLMAAQGTGLLFLSPPTLIFAAQYGLFRASPELASLYERQELLPFLKSLPRESPVLAAASLLTMAFQAVLVALSLRALSRARLGAHAAVHGVLLLTLVYLVVVSAGPEASDDRYRLPLMPILSLYAAAGLGTMGRA